MVVVDPGPPSSEPFPATMGERKRTLSLNSVSGPSVAGSSTPAFGVEAGRVDPHTPRSTPLHPLSISREGSVRPVIPALAALPRLAGSAHPGVPDFSRRSPPKCV